MPSKSTVFFLPSLFGVLLKPFKEPGERRIFYIGLHFLVFSFSHLTLSKGLYGNFQIATLRAAGVFIWPKEQRLASMTSRHLFVPLVAVPAETSGSKALGAAKASKKMLRIVVNSNIV